MEKKELKRWIILNEPILPLLIKMSVPTIIGMLIMVIYNLTDTYFVGLLNNKSMIAALGVVFSFMSIIQAIGFWFGYGSGNIMSKKLGAQEEEKAENISSLGIVFSLVIGILIAILSITFILPLAKFIGGNATPTLLIFTIKYLKPIIISIPFSLYSITLYNQLRLSGNVKEGMIGLLLGVISNIILDPILIFYLNLGFVGSGYATLIGQLIAGIILTILARKNSYITINLKKVKYSNNHTYHILIGGLPNFSRQGITSISLILLNQVAANYGDSIIAALTISSRIIILAYLIMIGWAQGFQPICAMNYGAEKYGRVHSAFKLTAGVATIFLIFSAIILYTFSDTFVKAMTKNSDVILAGSKLIRLQCLTMPFLGYFAVICMYMQNIGKYFQSLLISISRQGIFFIPLLYILINMYGELGIYLLQPLADILSVILAIIVIRFFNNYK